MAIIIIITGLTFLIIYKALSLAMKLLFRFMSSDQTLIAKSTGEVPNSAIFVVTQQAHVEQADCVEIETNIEQMNGGIVEK